MFLLLIASFSISGTSNQALNFTHQNGGAKSSRSKGRCSLDVPSDRIKSQWRSTPIPYHLISNRPWIEPVEYRTNAVYIYGRGNERSSSIHTYQVMYANGPGHGRMGNWTAHSSLESETETTVHDGRSATRSEQSSPHATHQIKLD